MHSGSDGFVRGSWNAICDRCGGKFKSHDLRLTWDRLRVCDRCWETRHPQDWVRAAPAERPPDWTRPESAPIFVLFCDKCGMSAVAGIGTAGCALAGWVSPLVEECGFGDGLCTIEGSSDVADVGVAGCMIPTGD